MNNQISGRDIYRFNMIQKIVTWDWSKSAWNQYSSFFDDAITILSDDEDYVKEFNSRKSKFETKYGMTLKQAETRVYMRLTGMSWKRLVKQDGKKYPTSSKRYFNTSVADREINWLDIVEDLSKMRVWVLEKVKDVSEDMGIGSTYGV